ncbi:hypothetical protein IQ268_15885 [Oculatella sp. LEGE 06141]|uniref:DUF6519 domain-containing protein n=1 Tax=Oculatella sp. LEGE 06141 TaxID=1828648 RepID=UPI00187EBE86|nr:DUF6519 domain-containing protein [Oculatella sp. LEGE 06141]MBE9180051.1 hypothetical protein [Oculatella sp. LEGE 06141]
MQGDFSRDTFAVQKHFRRVLKQQGRVDLDADWNEQISILLHYLQTLTADLIGPHGGPAGHSGFEVSIDWQHKTIGIGAGHYYVAGILCENETPCHYYHQPDCQLDRNDEDYKLPKLPFLVYLDVWEQHVSAVEDSSIREVALNGADTATRSRVVWQVKTVHLNSGSSDCANLDPSWDALVEQWQPKHRGRMRAKLQNVDQPPSTDRCTISPDARYRGENQLYRVEIHQSSPEEGDELSQGATFKWSRDNASVVFPIRSIAVTQENDDPKTTVLLEHLGRDSRFGLAAGNWVEIVDHRSTWHQGVHPLLQIESIDVVERRLVLKGAPAHGTRFNEAHHPLLRRWDSAGAIDTRSAANDGWIPLEDGIEVKFEADGAYRSGDYWFIPARRAIANIEWEMDHDQPAALPPHGVMHYFAPLAVIASDRYSGQRVVHDCRCTFTSLECRPYYGSNMGVGGEQV